MRPKTTLILLAVTLGLIGYILFHERHIDTSPEAIENNSRVVNLDPEKVTRIEIVNSHGKGILQKKKDGSWQMESPIDDRPDEKLLDELIKRSTDLVIYESLSEDELKSEGVKPEEFGFGKDKDKISMRFFGGKEELAAFEIGDRSDVKDMSYIRKVGDWHEHPVHIAWGRVREISELSFEELRDHHLLPIEAEQVRRVKFVRGQGSVMAEWDLNKERWMMRNPLQTRASKSAIDERLSTLMATEIVDYLDESDPAAQDAFQENRLEIRVWIHKMQGGTDIQLAQAGGAGGDEFVFAKVSDRKGIFKLPKTILNAFTVNPNDLRDRNLADLDAKSLAGIIIEQQNRDGTILQPIEMENYQGKWVLIRNGQKERADSVKIEGLIKKLNEEQIIEFAADAASDLTQYGLDFPLHTLSFVTRVMTVPEDPKSTEPPKVEEKVSKLLISTTTKGVYAKYDSEPFIYRIPTYLVGFLKQTQTVNWKSPELINFGLLALKKMSIEKHPNPPIELTYDVSTNSFAAEAGGEDLTSRISQKRAMEIVSRLSNFHVVGWTADVGQALNLLNTVPLLVVRAEVNNAETQKADKFKITFAPTPAGVKGEYFYGQIAGTPDVFIVNRASFLVLYESLLAKEMPKPATGPNP